jgi:hypothetical protein
MNTILISNDYNVVYKNNKEIYYEKNISFNSKNNIYEKILIINTIKYYTFYIYYHKDYSITNNLDHFIFNFLIYQLENLNNGKYMLQYINEQNILYTPLMIIKKKKSLLNSIDNSIYDIINKNYMNFNNLPQYIINQYFNIHNISRKNIINNNSHYNNSHYNNHNYSLYYNINNTNYSLNIIPETYDMVYSDTYKTYNNYDDDINDINLYDNSYSNLYNIINEIGDDKMSISTNENSKNMYNIENTNLLNDNNIDIYNYIEKVT